MERASVTRDAPCASGCGRGLVPRRGHRRRRPRYGRRHRPSGPPSASPRHRQRLARGDIDGDGRLTIVHDDRDHRDDVAACHGHAHDDRRTRRAGLPARSGYWILDRGGRSTPSAMPGTQVARSGGGAVDIEPSPVARYWLVNRSGTVASFGGATQPRLARHSAGGRVARRSPALPPIPTAGDTGCSRPGGRVIPPGSARLLGDLSATALDGPVLDSIATPSGTAITRSRPTAGMFASATPAPRARWAGSGSTPQCSRGPGPGRQWPLADRPRDWGEADIWHTWCTGLKSDAGDFGEYQEADP